MDRTNFESNPGRFQERIDLLEEEGERVDRLSRLINARFHGQFRKLERQTAIPKCLGSREAISAFLCPNDTLLRVSLSSLRPFFHTKR